MAATMEDPVAPSTPSAGTTSRIRTPTAPLHGYSDSYEPYSPRKSTRIAQRTANRTPSPQPSRHFSEPQQTSLGSPKSTRKRYTSNMATPTLSPQKKRMPAMDSMRKVSGSLTAEGTATAAVALGLATKPASKPSPFASRAGTMAGAGNLITPAKTPLRSPTDKVKANVRSVARNLFVDDAEIMPTPSRSRSDNYTLDSFFAREEDEIQIYTDSHERIPEIDDSAENPFYVGNASAAPEPPRRRSTRQVAQPPQMIRIPGEGKVAISEAVQREDGMVTVFRGKKQYRKFKVGELGSSSREGLDQGDGGLEGAVTQARPFTRSSIKRVLFPVAKADEPVITNEDEEAATDIEDHVLAGMEASSQATPFELTVDAPGTPEAPRFAPASPPTTVRTTRLGSKKGADSTPMKAKSATKRSPFDGWRRVKGGAETSGHKRPGDDLPGTAAKRSRA